MLKKLLFAAVSALAVPALSQAQVLPCGTTEAMDELMRQDPSYAKHIANLLENNKIVSQDPNLRQSLTQYTIPVVIHVMHDYGASNITRAQVLDAIRILNDDFNQLNPDSASVIAAFKPLVANIGINFRLAQIDPDGNCTEGITRHYTPLTNSGSNALKNIVRWDPSKYLNVWLANTMESGSGGYSYLPCVSSTIDGIVLRNSQFGSIGTSSNSGVAPSSLTHEVGHYLGLPHTWGGSNTPGVASNCSIDDGIADTPNTVGVTGQHCNTNMQSCSTLNNVQNFMDYANCQIMFTLGQKAVMLDALTKPCRTTLWSQSNLVATGTNDGFTPTLCAPVVDFNANRKRVCAGSSVIFTDLSYNGDAGSRTWSFPGGTPSTSTDPNPTVVYSTPGEYAVTLVATNAAGADTLVEAQYIKVLSTTTGLEAPYSESFESADFPVVPGDEVKNWERVSTTTTTWERTDAGMAIDGNYAMRIKHGFIADDRVNSLISPNIDLTGITQPVLTFKVAYALPQGATSSSDRLRVYISTDCGQNWVLRMAKAGTSLATATSLSSQFEPTDSSHWRLESTTLPSTATQVMLKFESTSGLGNTLYLDAVNINGNLVGLSEEVNQLGLQVFPNPNDGLAVISYDLTEGGNTTLSLTNTLGQEVVSLTRHEQAGKQEHQLGTISSKLATGVYFIRLQTANKVSIQKVVIR